jgi:hypothetical protein
VTTKKKFYNINVRLTQMENGSWRLEDTEKPTPGPPATAALPTTVSKTKKKKSKDSNDGDAADSPQQLLRRPSIKKIRALFSKDPAKVPAADAEESKEVLAAISKLPKFDPANGNLKSESASMPNSLDRRLGHQVSVS